MKSLVLGGRTGLLGQALVTTLSGKGFTAVTLGRDDGDLLDIDFLAKVMEREKPDAVFNAIAWTQVDDAEEHEAEATRWNRTLPANLARLSKSMGFYLLTYSTDFVFSGQKNSPYKPDDLTGPLSVYGATKLEGERQVAAIGADTCGIVRTAWLFGPGRKNFITTILDACRKRDTISVVHDQIGSPTYSLDLAAWSVMLAEKKAPGIFHGVNSGRASWCELAHEAVNLTGANCRVLPITSAEWPMKAKRPAYSVLDASLLHNVIGITPRPWTLALRDYIFNNLTPAHKTL